MAKFIELTGSKTKILFNVDHIIDVEPDAPVEALPEFISKHFGCSITTVQFIGGVSQITKVKDSYDKIKNLLLKGKK